MPGDQRDLHHKEHQPAADEPAAEPEEGFDEVDEQGAESFPASDPPAH